jgi:hypothetical protein
MRIPMMPIPTSRGQAMLKYLSTYLRIYLILIIAIIVVAMSTLLENPSIRPSPHPSSNCPDLNWPLLFLPYCHYPTPSKLSTLKTRVYLNSSSCIHPHARRQKKVKVHAQICRIAMPPFLFSPHPFVNTISPSPAQRSVL